jgi:hypothetical protein
MRLSFILGGIAAVVLLAACNHAAPEAPPSAAGAVTATAGTVPPAPGTGSIRGRGLARLPPDGVIVTCARLKVQAIGPGDRDTVRETTCDANGYFVFNDLEPGAWGLRTDVVWRIKDDPTKLQGIHLGAPHVVVQAGKEVHETLSEVLCCGRAPRTSSPSFFEVDMATGKIYERLF